MGLALGMTLKFYTSVAKGLTFLGLSPTFVEATGKKLVEGPFLDYWLNFNNPNVVLL